MLPPSDWTCLLCRQWGLCRAPQHPVWGSAAFLWPPALARTQERFMEQTGGSRFPDSNRLSSRSIIIQTLQAVLSRAQPLSCLRHHCWHGLAMALPRFLAGTGNTHAEPRRNRGAALYSATAPTWVYPHPTRHPQPRSF